MAAADHPRGTKLPANSPADDLASWCEGVVGQAFTAAGWEVTKPSASHAAPDLICRKGDAVYVVEVRAAAGRARHATLQALLADAVLQARSAATPLGGSPLAVVATPALSERMATQLAEYMRAHADGTSWGLVDGRGTFRFRGPGLDDLRAQRTEHDDLPTRGQAPTPATPSNPFTDRGQWVMKVLLASHLPTAWLQADRRPLRTQTDLVAAADIPQPTASRVVRAFRDAGFVEKSRSGLAPVRLEGLLKAWRSACQRPVDERPARFLFATDRARDTLVKSLRKYATDPLGGGRACLGLFAACDELDLGIVSGAPLHLYAERLDDALLERLDLVPVAAGFEADVFVRRPATPEAVFRAAVTHEGVPTADVLQCWLDVSHHPTRGAEQADHLLSVLRPHLEAE